MAFSKSLKMKFFMKFLTILELSKKPVYVLTGNILIVYFRSVVEITQVYRVLPNSCFYFPLPYSLHIVFCRKHRLNLVFCQYRCHSIFTWFKFLRISKQQVANLLLYLLEVMNNKGKNKPFSAFK